MEIIVTKKYVIVIDGDKKVLANKHVYKKTGKLVHFMYSGEPVVNFLRDKRG